jgi:hypothetical protein
VANDPRFSLRDIGLFLVELFSHVASQHHLNAPSIEALDPQQMDR